MLSFTKILGIGARVEYQNAVDYLDRNRTEPVILMLEPDKTHAGSSWTVVPLTIEDLWERLQKYGEQRNAS